QVDRRVVPDRGAQAGERAGDPGGQRPGGGGGGGPPPGGAGGGGHEERRSWPPRAASAGRPGAGSAASRGLWRPGSSSDSNGSRLAHGQVVTRPSASRTSRTPPARSPATSSQAAQLPPA